MKILKNKIFLVFVFAILFPLVTPNPTFWITNVGSRTLWIGLIALSMTYMNKNLGLMSLGQLFFAGVTGYTIAILTIMHGVNYAISIPLGVIFGTLAGALIGWVALKAEGVYYLMLTLALTLGLYSLANQAEAITHGHTGINAVATPRPFGIDFNKPKTFYFTCLIINVVFFLLLKRLERSSFGLALNGIRDNADRTSALGYNNTALKWFAFILSSFIASISGIIGLFYYQAISPDTVGLVRAIDLLVVVVVGGATYLGGAYVGAAAIAVFENLIQDYTQYYVGATGLLFILILMLAPQGLMGIGQQLSKRRAVRN